MQRDEALARLQSMLRWTLPNEQEAIRLALDRIAQLVIAPVVLCGAEWVEELSETDRGGGGFGSTGN